MCVAKEAAAVMGHVIFIFHAAFLLYSGCQQTCDMSSECEATNAERKSRSRCREKLLNFVSDIAHDTPLREDIRRVHG